MTIEDAIVDIGKVVLKGLPSVPPGRPGFIFYVNDIREILERLVNENRTRHKA